MVLPVFTQLSEQRSRDLSVTFSQHLTGLVINDILGQPTALEVLLGTDSSSDFCVIQLDEYDER